MSFLLIPVVPCRFSPLSLVSPLLTLVHKSAHSTPWKDTTSPQHTYPFPPHPPLAHRRLLLRLYVLVWRPLLVWLLVPRDDEAHRLSGADGAQHLHHLLLAETGHLGAVYLQQSVPGPQTTVLYRGSLRRRRRVHRGS